MADHGGVYDIKLFPTPSEFFPFSSTTTANLSPTETE